MVNVPHTFPFLRQGDALPLLICGAGASWDLIPLPADIVHERRRDAEDEISKITGRPFPPLAVASTAWDALYVWAQQAYDELTRIGHPCPKLKIAQALGLLSDDRWLAGVEQPVAVSKPRHRVIARLAREKRWRSIWSFNWDCHVEAALESVGFSASQNDATNQPWPVRYHRVLSLSDYGLLPHGRTVLVHKRHGCVKKLKDLEDLYLAGGATAEQLGKVQFRILKSELDVVLDTGSPDYQAFFGTIASEYVGSPLVVCGWSASEKYLLDEFQKCSQQLQSYPHPGTRLSIIDTVFNTSGHVVLAQIYGVTSTLAYVPVSNADNPNDQDALFLWIQTLYAMEKLRKLLQENAALQAWADETYSTLESDDMPGQLTYWVDAFLPAWVRLCWRAGLIKARHEGMPMSPEEIRLEGDWYVPIDLPLDERPELVSAAWLLKALLVNPESWDFSFVQGGIFCPTTQNLVIPLPAWKLPTDYNVLNSLRRIADDIREKRALVSRLVLLPLTLDGAPPSADVSESLRAAFLQLTNNVVDAQGDRVLLTDLSAIEMGAV